jgi:hypothetical protein
VGSRCFIFLCASLLLQNLASYYLREGKLGNSSRFSNLYFNYLYVFYVFYFEPESSQRPDRGYTSYLPSLFSQWSVDRGRMDPEKFDTPVRNVKCTSHSCIWLMITFILRCSSGCRTETSLKTEVFSCIY